MSIQNVREYWDRRPCNIRHSTIDIDEFPIFYSWVVSDRKYRVEPHIPSFADFPRWGGCSVLELGCGIGTDALSFVAHGARVVAIDISAASLVIARKRARALKQDGTVIFLQGDIEEFEIAAGILVRQFDLVYSFGAIHHTPHPKHVLRQIQRHMHRKSTLKIMLYHRYTPKVLVALIRYWRPGMSVDEAVAKMSEAQQGCPITYTYTKKSAAELLRDFEILDMHVDHIFPYNVRGYLNYKYTFNWWYRWMPPRLFRWLEKHFGWHLLITARLK